MSDIEGRIRKELESDFVSIVIGLHPDDDEYYKILYFWFVDAEVDTEIYKIDFGTLTSDEEYAFTLKDGLIIE